MSAHPTLWDPMPDRPPIELGPRHSTPLHRNTDPVGSRDTAHTEADAARVIDGLSTDDQVQVAMVCKLLLMQEPH